MSTRDERLAAFGRALRTARDSKGWSQTRLAEEISRVHEDRVTQGAVSYWESGTNSPDIDKVRATETALGLKADTLVRVLTQVEVQPGTVAATVRVPSPTVTAGDVDADGNLPEPPGFAAHSGIAWRSLPRAAQEDFYEMLRTMTVGWAATHDFQR